MISAALLHKAVAAGLIACTASGVVVYREPIRAKIHHVTAPRHIVKRKPVKRVIHRQITPPTCIDAVLPVQSLGTHLLPIPVGGSSSQELGSFSTVSRVSYTSGGFPGFGVTTPGFGTPPTIPTLPPVNPPISENPTSPVPEPTTWATMGVGFFLIALATRYKVKYEVYAR